MKRQPGKAESVVSWCVMGGLVVITAGVYLKQFHFDRSILIPPVDVLQQFDRASKSPAFVSDLSEFAPPGLVVMNGVEIFSADTLYEKINGKAELYLSAGFEALRAQRFVSQAEAASWMEVFLYEMKSLPQAFAAFSNQRRPGAEPTDLTPFSYRTRNALFFVHGPYYVEIISSVPSGNMMDAMVAFGEAFVERTHTSEQIIKELALFPAEQLLPFSARLFVSDAFGFSGLTNVFAVEYGGPGEALTAFLSRRESPDEAARIVGEYEAFLLENGGAGVPLKNPLPNAAMIEIFDRFELIFSHRHYVAGVHDAQDKIRAEGLARMIHKRLVEIPYDDSAP